MALRKWIRNGMRTAGFSLAMAGAACIGGDSTYTNDPTEENLQNAFNYVDSKLRSRGYTIQYDQLIPLVNPSDGDVIAVMYDLRATESVSGDDQLWRMGATPDAVTIRDARVGMPPDIGIIETDTTYATLDTMIDEFCNN